jgi:ABC-type multidrug transport system fused ATPase/permease subunit
MQTLVQPKAHVSAYANKPDVIAMRDCSYYFVEGENATVDVMRLGDCTEECQVSYTTLGKGGDDFTCVSGTLTFAPGDGIESFTVPITNDDCWETMEHFSVELTKIEKGNAVLGTVTKSKIYIVDDDNYPQNFPCLENDPPTEPGPWELMWGFIRERWRHRHPKPIKSMACVCYGGIHSVVATYVPIIIIDDYVKKDRIDWVVFGILAAVYLVSNLIKWYLHIKFMDWRGNSGTRKDLRNWLVTKYVYFSEAVHLEIDNTHFFDCAINMVEETVVKGWFQHFQLGAALFDLSLQLALAIKLEKLAVLPLGFLIPVIIITVKCRQAKFEKLLKIRMHAEDAWLGVISDIFANWMVINAYNARDDRAGAFKKIYEEFYKKHRASRFYQLDYKWIPRFANEIVLAGVLMFGGAMVVDGLLTMGKYVALIKIFQRIGSRLVKIAEILINFQRGIEGLRRVSEMLNYPTGVGEEIKQQKQQMLAAQAAFDTALAQTVGVSKAGGKFLRSIDKESEAAPEAAAGDDARSVEADAQRAIARAIIQEHLATTSKAGCTELSQFVGGWTDSMLTAALSIQVENASFHYPQNKGHQAMENDVLLLNGLNATIPLGHFVAMCPMLSDEEALTNGGAGITTLMKILTSQLYATAGEVKIPPHLTTLLVHHEPLILAEPLLKNLTFGNPKCPEDFAWKVAAELGLSPQVIQRGNFHMGFGGFSLRLVDRQIVCIARALIADPHILCIIKPAATFSKHHSEKVFQVLKDWQERKGLWEGKGAGDQAAPGQDPILNTRTVLFGMMSGQPVPTQVDIIATLQQRPREEGGSLVTLLRNGDGAKQSLAIADL